jgi:hypothetical protein
VVQPFLFVLLPGLQQIHPRDAIAATTGREEELHLIPAAAQGLFSPAHQPPAGLRTLAEVARANQRLQASLPSLLRLSGSNQAVIGDLRPPWFTTFREPWLVDETRSGQGFRNVPICNELCPERPWAAGIP